MIAAATVVTGMTLTVWCRIHGIRIIGLIGGYGIRAIFTIYSVRIEIIHNKCSLLQVIVIHLGLVYCILCGKDKFGTYEG